MKPIIGVTMGDAAGIGPEVIVKALQDKRIHRAARVVVLGDVEVLRAACRLCSLACDLKVIGDPAEGSYEAGKLNVAQAGRIEIRKLARGTVLGMCGQASYDAIFKSVELALSGKVQAVATAPINKESLRAAGIQDIGHTEIYEALSSSVNALTMFEVHSLRIFFFTRHMSLRAACDRIKKDALVTFFIRCAQELQRLQVAAQPLAVAGLNPHGGEHGLFGAEEVEQITPAILEARKLGYDVVGPIGADSVFHQALEGRYSAVVALYHDQGHIAAKTYDFERTISVTLGLPFIRTSVDHGTAFDIAGTGEASAVSMREAILVAAKYAKKVKA